MAEDWKWFVYIIECLDGTFYTGCSWNVGHKLTQHLSGLGSKYTAKHGVKKLVYYEEHNDLEDARKRETQIKNWSQAKKRKLIAGEWKNDW